MSNDRPLFDDEELPSWLKNAGISGGQGNQPDSSANAAQPSSTDANSSGSSDDDLSWLDDASAQFGSSSNDQAPWMADAAPVEPAAPSGDLPSWMTNQD